MSIKLRLTLLVSLLLGGFLTTYLLLRAFEQNESEHAEELQRRAQAQLLGHWLDATNRALPQFTADAAHSDRFGRWVANPDSTGTEEVTKHLVEAGLDALWLVTPSGEPAVRVQASADSGFEFPLSPAEFRALARETPSPRFFAQQRGEILELAVRRLLVGSEPRGWIAVARRWNERQLSALGELTESRITIVPADQLESPAADPAVLVLLRPLLDWQGRPLRALRIEHDFSASHRAFATALHPTRLFLGFGLLVLAAIALALQGWVLKPLNLIGVSLARGDSQLVAALAQQKSELGRIAQLVQSAFAQREALEREVKERTAIQHALERSEAELRRTFEERARLGRDLHDGVIQSLYAAGMGLAGIRTQLRPEQSEAAARLEQTRAALNETIHDVRNFIIGLEPEALKLQTFSQAVAALLETMQPHRAFRSNVDIDEQLAARLSLAQRVHALQITREAVSNALRHGAANTLQVSLKLAGAFAEFQIADDGRGFDPNDIASSGQGLRNLAQRARELGAELSVDSKPGAGARVKLVFSLHHYD